MGLMAREGLHLRYVCCLHCETDCDYVTPLCSQVTYEGLLDDTFGINSGLCAWLGGIVAIRCILFSVLLQWYLSSDLNCCKLARDISWDRFCPFVHAPTVIIFSQFWRNRIVWAQKLRSCLLDFIKCIFLFLSVSLCTIACAFLFSPVFHPIMWKRFNTAVTRHVEWS